MTPTMTIEEVLTHYGWTIECRSPYELRHTDGSFASGGAAVIVELALGEEAIFDGVTKRISD